MESFCFWGCCYHGKKGLQSEKRTWSDWRHLFFPLQTGKGKKYQKTACKGCAEIVPIKLLPVKPHFSHGMWPCRLFSRVWPYRPGDMKSGVWGRKRNHYAKKKIPNIRTNDTAQHQITWCRMKQHHMTWIFWSVTFTLLTLALDVPVGLLWWWLSWIPWEWCICGGAVIGDSVCFGLNFWFCVDFVLDFWGIS